MRQENRPARRDPELRWQLLDALSAGREAWDLKDRTLSVLRALLSYLPRGERLDLVVFPSNRSLSARLMGMPESTLRRHLARLVDAGLVVRRASPNGKRYRIGGDLTFGLDLSPFFAAGSVIRARAEAAEVMRQRVRVLRARLREALVGIADLERVARVKRLLRRKVGAKVLEASLADLTSEMAVSAAQNDRHSYPSTDPLEPEQDVRVGMEALEKVGALAERPIRNEATMREAGARASLMLGVHDAWTICLRARGPAWATMALAFLLPRQERLRRPGAYLAALSRRAGAGGFDLIAALDRDRRAEFA